MTREVVTAADRLQAARAERKSLLRRLENATTDTEAEALRRRLDLNAMEIRGLRSQLRDLSLRTNYAAVSLSLVEDGGNGGSGGWSAARIDDALDDALDSLVGSLGHRPARARRRDPARPAGGRRLGQRPRPAAPPARGSALVEA